MARRSDPRFDDMHHAPIFKKVKKESFKTKLDDRFKTVLTDDRFNASAKGEGVDKHGKKTSGSKKKAASELKAFYNIDDKPSSSRKPTEGDDKAESRLDYLSKLSRGEISGSSSDSDDDSGEDGKASSDSDSSSEDSDSEDEHPARKGGALSIPGDEIVTTRRRGSQLTAVQEGEEHEEGDEEAGDEADVETSNRLAIQNCDWDNMSAEDIMAILQSFCSTMSLEKGSVKSVTVYPSDYGLERMEAENMHGPPKEIWNNTGSTSDKESDGESEEESEEDGADSGSGSGSESDSEDDEGQIHIMKKNKPEELRKSGILVNERVRKSKEFDREGSSTGLVFNLDNGDSDEEDLKGHAGAASSSRQRAPKPSSGDSINALALREYELSKLRYYFAIAVLDNALVAEKLYNELDGIEFEHSSMALDLRFVPNDVSFESRRMRDRYEGTISAGYAPPEGFVVNALQKTNVECSWDNDEGSSRSRAGMKFSTGDDDDDVMVAGKGSGGGKRKPTTASAWRRLQESDMSQYMASGSSSDEDEDGEKESDKKKRAAKLRKLLLGGGEEEGSEDDFFMRSEDEEGEAQDINSSDDDDMGEGDTDKVMTFVPTSAGGSDEEGGSGSSKKKSRKQKKAEKEAAREDWEVPQETLKRLREEKKNEKKKAKRARDGGTEEESKDEMKKNSDLELLFAGDEDSDEEGRDRLNFTKKELAVTAELKQTDHPDSSSTAKKKRKLSKSKAKLLAETKTDSFKIDMTDSRFSKVLEGDADYGIDRLSNEYRPTPAMEMILNERNNRKIAEDKKGKGKGRDKGGEDGFQEGVAAAGDASAVSASKLSLLASKLKKNFNKK